MPTTLQEWVEGYRLAWENRDADAAARLFTSDGTYRSNIYDDAHEGQAGVTAYWSSVTATQGNVHVRMGRPFADGSRVAVEFWTLMDVDGEATTLAGCLLLDFADDWLCQRLREYWNFTPGTCEPPSEWGE